MSALQNPVKINRLWKKINDRYGPDDEEDEKKLTGRAKDAAKQRKKVDKGLNVLKVLAKGGVKTPGKVKKFESNRGKLLKGLKKYCKLLKGSKIEGIQDQTKYRKSVLQLTVVIEELSPNQVTDEEGDEDINALLGIQTDKVESSLDDPALDTEEDEEFDAVEEETEEASEEESGEVPQAPPKPQESLAATFKARMQALKTRYQEMTAMQPPPANLGQMVNLMTAILTSGGKKDYTQGVLQLDQLEAELNKASGTTKPSSKAPSTADLAAEWKAKLAEWSPAIKTAMAAKGPDAAAIAKLLAQATALSKPGGDMAQALEKLTECHGLATTGTGDNAGTGNDAGPELAAWKADRETAAGQLRDLAAAIAKSQDPDATKVIVLINAIIKNLTPSPGTRQQVLELERYLQTDDIIKAVERPNPFGVQVKVRAPLLKSVTALKQKLPD